MQKLATWTVDRITHQLSIRTHRTACDMKATYRDVGKKRKSGTQKRRLVKDHKLRTVTCLLCLANPFTGTGEDAWR